MVLFEAICGLKVGFKWAYLNFDWNPVLKNALKLDFVWVANGLVLSKLDLLWS